SHSAECRARPLRNKSSRTIAHQEPRLPAIYRSNIYACSFQEPPSFQDFFLLLQPLVGLRYTLCFGFAGGSSPERAVFAHYAPSPSEDPLVVGDGQFVLHAPSLAPMLRRHRADTLLQISALTQFFLLLFD